MNKHSRHPNLPLLSTLLIPDPPVIVVNAKSNYPNHHIDYKLSPLSSPIDSISSNCSSLPSPNLLAVNQSSFLPPLQGDDPPKRLKRYPSISSIASNSSLLSLNTKPTLWHVSAPSLSPLMPSIKSPSPFLPFSYLAASEQQEELPLLSPTISQQDHRPLPPLPPSTQTIVNEEGKTILKRRRGRLPSLREPSLEGGWTFLTPTVWDVKSQQQVSQNPDVEEPQPSMSVNNGAVATFSSSDVNMTLPISRKKRGRKPKTHIVGNSCFVWKDISVTRKCSKVIKLAQQQQDVEHPPITATRLRKIEKAPPTPNI
ncbi:hypothetical protein BD408DRAFT_416081 [Parasitella parasitica]|nr:hypothetical protein BD408DRAFT_416081 [Parasitella parasitica]